MKESYFTPIKSEKSEELEKSGKLGKSGKSGKSEKFSSAFRVKKKIHVSRIFSTGTFITHYPLNFKYVKNQQKESRILLSLKKHCGNAPQRNRFKRQVREAFRLNYQLKFMGYDISIIYTRKLTTPLSYQQISACLEKLKNTLSHLQ
ncbi:MAG: ribonuclease P protein component [SAR324 cluster bacterium]|nr:ribonuclease P protein component [SAR324 cluster bacterium]